MTLGTLKKVRSASEREDFSMAMAWDVSAGVAHGGDGEERDALETAGSLMPMMATCEGDRGCGWGSGWESLRLLPVVRGCLRTRLCSRMGRRSRARRGAFTAREYARDAENAEKRNCFGWKLDGHGSEAKDIYSAFS
jgi:hypothetical protein